MVSECSSGWRHFCMNVRLLQWQSCRWSVRYKRWTNWSWIWMWIFSDLIWNYMNSVFKSALLSRMHTIQFNTPLYKLYGHQPARRLRVIMLRHSFVPSDFRFGLIKPVLKDKHGDITCTDMYRPITITTVMSNSLASHAAMRISLARTLSDVLATWPNSYKRRRWTVVSVKYTKYILFNATTDWHITLTVSLVFCYATGFWHDFLWLHLCLSSASRFITT